LSRAAKGRAAYAIFLSWGTLMWGSLIMQARDWMVLTKALSISQLGSRVALGKHSLYCQENVDIYNQSK
jgi:hypothetical protein